MAQLSMQTLEELYNNLTILQFWKNKERVPFVDYIECCKKDLRNEKSTLFLETLQFLIKSNATSKELKLKGLTRLPESPVEHREFISSAVEFFSTVFPELHLAKSNFTGTKILETLRTISIRTLASHSRQKDMCSENITSRYDEEILANSLKLLIANEVRKHQQLKAAAQQKRKELLMTVQKIRKCLESIIVHFDSVKANNEISNGKESVIRDDEQVVYLMLTWISKFTETLSNVAATNDISQDEPLTLKSSTLKRYQSWVDRNVLRMIPWGEEVEEKRTSHEALISSKTEETYAMEDAVYSFIQKIESIVPESL